MGRKPEADRSGCYQPERQLPGGICTRKERAPFHGARKESRKFNQGCTICHSCRSTMPAAGDRFRTAVGLAEHPGSQSSWPSLRPCATATSQVRDVVGHWCHDCSSPNCSSAAHDSIHWRCRSPREVSNPTARELCRNISLSSPTNGPGSSSRQNETECSPVVHYSVPLPFQLFGGQHQRSGPLLGEDHLNSYVGSNHHQSRRGVHLHHCG